MDETQELRINLDAFCVAIKFLKQSCNSQDTCLQCIYKDICKPAFDCGVNVPSEWSVK
jgi:hypothetical protein